MTRDHRTPALREQQQPAQPRSTKYAEARRRRVERARRLRHDERFDPLRGLRARRALVLLGCLLVAASGMLATLFLVTMVVGDAAEQRHLEALWWGFTLAALLAANAVRAWQEPEV